ncbi:hypothetical protein EDB83DRAFT_1467838 [Lactarius deliciosus]|nr:hypothetical protein EDB83DRAFT_1467838 [Lactarius deliciosus]
MNEHFSTSRIRIALLTYIFLHLACLLFSSFVQPPCVFIPPPFFSVSSLLVIVSTPHAVTRTSTITHFSIRTHLYFDNSGMFLVVFGHFQTHQHPSGFRIHAVILVVMVFSELLRKGTICEVDLDLHDAVSNLFVTCGSLTC